MFPAPSRTLATSAWTPSPTAARAVLRSRPPSPSTRPAKARCPSIVTSTDSVTIPLPAPSPYSSLTRSTGSPRYEPGAGQHDRRAWAASRPPRRGKARGRSSPRRSPPGRTRRPSPRAAPSASASSGRRAPVADDRGHREARARAPSRPPRSRTAPGRLPDASSSNRTENAGVFVPSHCPFVGVSIQYRGGHRVHREAASRPSPRCPRRRRPRPAPATCRRRGPSASGTTTGPARPRLDRRAAPPRSPVDPSAFRRKTVPSRTHDARALRVVRRSRAAPASCRS